MTLPTSPDGFAFFLDVDGTLIEIAPTPDSVVVPPGLPGVLTRLRDATGGALALLTGRDMATVDRLFAPAKLPVGAVHGTMLRFASGETVMPPPDPALAAIRARLAAFVAAHPGALLEEKASAVAVHYRAAPDLHNAVEAAVKRAVGAAGGGLAVQPGKLVFEIRPASADKGRALATFMGHPEFAGRRPLAIGDDLTDESMFVAAVERGGRAMRVGAGPFESIAPTEFGNPEAVRRWLTSLI